MKFKEYINGDATFKTKNPNQLVKELEALIDSGAASWSEILDTKH